MGRNSSFLGIILLLILCFESCHEKQYLGELPPVKVDFKDAVGNYQYIPLISEAENINDYKTFGLKKGDTLKLEIKSDSTFSFNHFYYDKMRKIENYQGKIEKDYNLTDFKIPFPKDASFDLQGFVKAKEGLYFYTRLKMKGFDNYEYQLFYKKVK